MLDQPRKMIVDKHADLTYNLASCENSVCKTTLIKERKNGLSFCQPTKAISSLFGARNDPRSHSAHN